MIRKDFLRTTLLGGISIFVLPQFSFFSIQDMYTREQLIGKTNPDIVGDSYTSKMHYQAKAAFQEMKNAASKANIDIEIVSAFRSFDRQKEIFESKYIQFTQEGLSPIQAIEKIIEYSTIPGTSRHHWGTDIDIIDANAKRPEDVLQEEHFQNNGPFCTLKAWLDEYANSFGFYEVYTNISSRKGFKYEPWHFSYAPVSIPMLKAYRSLDVKQILLEEKIMGSEYFSDEFISKYWAENILDINPHLLQ